MAAERVIFENIKRILSNKKNQWPFSSMKKLQNLEDAMATIEGAVAALEGKIKGTVEDEDKIEGAVPELESDKEKSVRSSLENLITLLHQADDLLDEIQTCATAKRCSEAGNQDENGIMGENPRCNSQIIKAYNRVSEKVSDLFPSFNSLMDSRVEKISRDVNQLGTQLLNEFSSYDQREISFALPQAYSLTKNTVIGRDIDKGKIIEMLLKPRKEDVTSISVITITGSPGIGKSALAQIVYDDEKVESHFDLKMWIQVSDKSANIDEQDIIKEIVDSCTNRRSGYKRDPKSAQTPHSQGFDLLGCRDFDREATTTSNSAPKNKNEMYERRLSKEIEGKLYLLVLDEAYIKHEQRLKDILSVGARGSRILMTLSHEEGIDFAEKEIIDSYTLNGLTEYDSWCLFRTFALRQEDKCDWELHQIGRTIANSCSGVPLTVKVAAGFVYGKRREEWESFKKDLICRVKNGDEIMKHVLHLSYNDLPAPLKACLCYCCLFPDDYRFNKRDLIGLWIAQGYIEPQSESLEDDAEKYFIELSRRCFFEDVITDDLRNLVTCKMHHIVRSLACEQAAGVASTYMTRTAVNQDLTCKHVSFSCDQDWLKKIPSSVLQSHNLRTLLSFQEPDCDTKLGTSECNKLILKFRCLRGLDLHDLGIEKLPESIGKLIHLRYLDLSKNDSLVTLPKSFTELINLQKLKLNSCTQLKRLPSNIGKLENLKHLEVDECDSLTSMPLSLEKLTQLETLSRFPVGQDISKDNAGLKALQKLNNLRGKLAIELTGDWTTTIAEAPLAELQYKTRLAKLKISWVKKAFNDKKTSHLFSKEEKKSSPRKKEEKVSYKNLLNQLQPNPNLKILYIEGYKGDDLPNWAGVNTLTTSLPNLVVVTIEGCDKCEHLPPFGELPVLKRLTLRHMTNVRYVQGERTCLSPSFLALEELTLHNFYKLEEWWKPPKMMVIHQKEFPPFLKLSKLRLRNCPNLRSMPLFTQVLDLDLINVNHMLLETCAEQVSSYTKFHIQRLLIMGCPNLSSFTSVRKGLGGLRHLEQLVIEKSHELISLVSELLYLTSLERLEISRCKELNLSDMNNPWTSLKLLRHLTLREIPKMKTLPEGLKHVQSLRSLWISGCPALTALPEWIGHLTTLQHLRIESCQNLKRLPEGLKEVKTLMKVEITECLELLKRCKEPTGKDWHKIQHARVLLYKSWRH